MWIVLHIHDGIGQWFELNSASIPHKNIAYGKGHA